jgi:hypothetical protein
VKRLVSCAHKFSSIDRLAALEALAVAALQGLLVEAFTLAIGKGALGDLLVRICGGMRLK